MENAFLTEEEVLRQIRASKELEQNYYNLPQDFRQRFLDFCTGVKGLPLTYDPIFKRIFDPETRPDRMSAFLSAILGEKVKVQKVLVNEGTRILEESSLLIMDIVVELENGSIANVEIQKVAYRFPGERAACYSSDLIMRQYSRVKREKKKEFSYHHMKPVYTIVLLEKSSADFGKIKDTYIHRSKQCFDSGLSLELLQQYVFVTLDRFREIKQNEVTEELDAWLHLLASEEPEIVYTIIEKYPKFQEIYEEIAAFRQDIGGVLSMFSEALKIMDQNMVRYMIDELQDELDSTNKELADKEKELSDRWKELENVNRELKDSWKELEDKEKELENVNKELSDSQKELENSQKELENSQKELEKSQKKLESSQIELENSQKELAEKERRIKELERKLAMQNSN